MGGDSPAAVLFDSYGNPVEVMYDAYDGYRLAVDAVVSGISTVKITDDEETDIVQVSTTGALHVTMTPTSLSGLVVAKLEDSGGEVNMNVDGSGTPINYTFESDPTSDLSIQHIQLLMVTNVLRMDNGSFGALPGPLTNGCRFAITSGGTEYVLALLKQTEDIVGFPGADITIETALTANDLLLASLNMGGALILEAGSSDKIEMRIQDDLTKSGANDIVLYEISVMATKA